MGNKAYIHLSITLIMSLLSACTADKNNYTIYDGSMLGTTAHIVAKAEGLEKGTLHQISQRLEERMQGEMSIFNPDSQLSRINRSESDSLTEGIIYNISLADSISRLSNGVYDITIAPLVKAWGFAGEQAQERPNIDSLLEFVGYEKISIEGNRLIKSDTRTSIDLNSIAKGYTVDLFCKELEKLGVVDYMVDIGGELRCRGTNHLGTPWRIGVESPIDGNMSNGEYINKRISMSGEDGLVAMATSGNYRRFYRNDKGEKIAHTIDPLTGKSKLSRLLSATVVSTSCALADGYGTMFMAIGSSGAIEMAKKIENCEVYFIFSGKDGTFEEYMSPKMESMILK